MRREMFYFILFGLALYAVGTVWVMARLGGHNG